MNTHWTDRLSSYLDDELAAEERATCEAHLEACRDCREALAGLRAVIAIAKADVDRLPTTDLWPGVMARIAGDAGTRARDRVVPMQPRRARSYTFTLSQLALAASLLIAVSAGVAYLAAGRALSEPPTRETPIQAMAEPLMPASADVERANFADEHYDQAVADFEKILVEMRDELDPRTVVVIERNLAAIDDAIREARAALEGDPANPFLNSHLVDARRKKLELLRRATMIHSTSGD